MKFDDYYIFYLSRHTNRWCRRCHLAGQAATALYVALAVWLGLAATAWAFALLLLAPLVVYPFAVAGHLFEGQWPAFFSSNPLYAKAADARMCWDVLRGKIPF